MKRIHFAVGLFAALACSGLQAETVMRANIPFEFHMGKTFLPAGDYQFRYASHVLTVQAEGGRAIALSLTYEEWRSKAPETPVVEFHRYGDLYFLSNIWTPDSREGAAVPKTAREKELLSRAQFKTEAIVLRTSR